MKPKEQVHLQENYNDYNNNTNHEFSKDTKVSFDSKLVSTSPSTTSSPPSLSSPTTYLSLGSFIKTSAGRLLLLILLVLNLSASTLLQRYTLVVEGRTFLPSAAVFVAESQKLIIAVLIGLFWEHAGSWKSYLSTIHTELRQNRTDTLLMAVPSIVYAIQNNLGYVALANLDPATYQVTIQLKIVTTALLMTLMLDVKLSKRKWVAILLLTAGVITVNMDNVAGGNSRDNINENTDINYAVGLSSVFAYCWCSAFASVYFERLLKKPSSGGQASLWIKNAQTYFFGSTVAALIMVGYDWRDLRANGVLNGFDLAVHMNVLLHSFGGVLVSLVMKYTDNIVKNFANGAAILLSTVGAVFFFQTQVGPLFFRGTVVVCVSAYLYRY